MTEPTTLLFNSGSRKNRRSYCGDQYIKGKYSFFSLKINKLSATIRDEILIIKILNYSDKCSVSTATHFHSTTSSSLPFLKSSWNTKLIYIIIIYLYLGRRFLLCFAVCMLFFFLFHLFQYLYHSH